MKFKKKFKKGDIVEVTLSEDSKFLGIVSEVIGVDSYDGEQQLNVRFLEKRCGTVITYGSEYSLGGNRLKLLCHYPEYFNRS